MQDNPYILRQRCDLVADALASSSIPELMGRATKIRLCSNDLRQSSITSRLYPYQACGVALCPCCLGRRYGKKQPYVNALPEIMTANPTAKGYAMTLTCPTIDVSEIRGQVHTLHTAFKGLLSKAPIRGCSYFRTLHVTRSEDGQAHPHLHCIAISKSAWDLNAVQEQWLDRVEGAQAAGTKINCLPRHEWARWLGYIVRDPYELGEKAIADSAFVQQLAQQIDGIRTYAPGGDFLKLKQKKKRSEASPSDRFLWDGSSYLQLAA